MTPFSRALDRLQGEKNVALGNMLPTLQDLKRSLKTLKEEKDSAGKKKLSVHLQLIVNDNLQSSTY